MKHGSRWRRRRFIHRGLLTVLAGLAACPAVASAAVDTTAARPEPIHGRSAGTVDSVHVEWQTEWFEDVVTQEARDFDGWTTRLGLVWPLGERDQVRVVWPLYTSGDAIITGTLPELTHLIGSTTHYRGNGGIYEYLTATWERQTRFTDVHGHDRAWVLGLGGRPEYLDTSHGDRFNHQGKLARLAVRGDRASHAALANWKYQLGVTWYFHSDDLNPSGGSDNFVHFDAIGTAVFGSWGTRLYPAIEGGYRGDLADYHDPFVTPQLSLRIGQAAFVTIAVEAGLSDDQRRSRYFVRLSF